jgi:hypothetical protein
MFKALADLKQNSQDLKKQKGLAERKQKFKDLKDSMEHVRNEALKIKVKNEALKLGLKVQ